MAKKKQTSESFIIRYFNRLVICFLLLNLLVIVLFERTKQPQIIRSVETVVTNHVIVVTNEVRTAGISSQDTQLSKFDLFTNTVNQVSVEYDFFVASGRIYIHLFGEYLTFGSPTSYGRLVDIFPDRSFTDQNFVLVNRKFLNVSKGENK